METPEERSDKIVIETKKGYCWFDCSIYGGREFTDIDAIAWAIECQERGAGEILLTSMDRDGTKDGYDLELTRTMSENLDIPVIASGGVGKSPPRAYLGRTTAADCYCASSFKGSENSYPG